MAKDHGGRTYYFNKSLNKSQYDMPEAESPPMPPPSTTGSAPPQDSSRGSTSSVLPCEPYEVDQRRNRIAKIRGILEFCELRSEKAELNGELAVLLREERIYMQSR